MSHSAFEVIFDEVTGELERIGSEETNILKTAERSITAVRAALDRIRESIIEAPFSSEAEEIHFFKVDKPRLASKLVYFMRIYKIETGRPIGSHDLQVRHLNTELSEIDQFFIRYQEFHNYYRSGSTFLDELYFVRGRQDMHFLMDTEWIYADPTFSTGYDLIVARMLANEELVSYLSKAILALEHRPVEATDETGDTNGKPSQQRGFAQTPYRGAEVYVFLKSLIDSQAVINHTYKSFFELTVPGIANMQQKSFIPGSLLKYSDKVDPETRENVKRLLQKMIRNIDNY